MVDGSAAPASARALKEAVGAIEGGRAGARAEEETPLAERGKEPIRGALDLFLL